MDEVSSVLRELVRITIPAVPVPQPRQRHRIVQPKNGQPFVMNYTPRKAAVQDFKATVRLAVQQAGLSAPADGPVIVDLEFYLPRPKRLMRAKDPDGPMPHTAKPDRDNLEKAVLDALKGLAWRDDAQVFDGRTRKWYAEKDGLPRVELVIWEVTAEARRAS